MGIIEKFERALPIRERGQPSMADFEAAMHKRERKMEGRGRGRGGWLEEQGRSVFYYFLQRI